MLVIVIHETKIIGAVTQTPNYFNLLTVFPLHVPLIWAINF